jgi:hypothetical protein
MTCVKLRRDWSARSRPSRASAFVDRLLHDAENPKRAGADFASPFASPLTRSVVEKAPARGPASHKEI